jgi:hypothetical protein
MHYIRFASVCMGAWLAGTILVWVANQNSPVIEELVQRPSRKAAQVMVKLEQPEGRAVLRHFAGTLDRRLCRRWEIVEIGLGLTVLISLFFGSCGKRYPGVLCVLMLGCVFFLHWFVGPEMERLAPAADFVQDSRPSVPRDRYRSLSQAYSTTVAVKLALGSVLVFGLIKRRRRRGNADLD